MNFAHLTFFFEQTSRRQCTCRWVVESLGAHAFNCCTRYVWFGYLLFWSQVLCNKFQMNATFASPLVSFGCAYFEPQLLVKTVSNVKAPHWPVWHVKVIAYSCQNQWRCRDQRPQNLLDHCWLVVTGCHQFGIFPWKSWEFHHPNWLTHIFSEGWLKTTNQSVFFFICVAGDQRCGCSCFGQHGIPEHPFPQWEKDIQFKWRWRTTAHATKVWTTGSST